MEESGKYDAPKPWKPSLTADVILIAVNEHGQRDVLLIRRKNPPFQGSWAFPGGFLDQGETTRQCAVREMKEETGVTIAEDQLHLLLVADDPHRDPRARVISIVYVAGGRKSDYTPRPGDDAFDVGWFPLDRPPALAFDHPRILEKAKEQFGDVL
jgi:8-oxo-dGTP diphosphatase